MLPPQAENLEQALASKNWNALARLSFELLVNTVAQGDSTVAAEVRRRDARGMNLLMAYLKNVTSVDDHILHTLSKIFE